MEMNNKNQEDMQGKDQNLFQDYHELMKNFDERVMINSTWEKRGDSYVQFSFYDENIICSSSTSLSGSL